MPRTIELYPFRYFDPLRRRWIEARYVLEAPAIRCLYPDDEPVGPLERASVVAALTAFRNTVIAHASDRA